MTTTMPGVVGPSNIPVTPPPRPNRHRSVKLVVAAVILAVLGYIAVQFMQPADVQQANDSSARNAPVASLVPNAPAAPLAAHTPAEPVAAAPITPTRAAGGAESIGTVVYAHGLQVRPITTQEYVAKCPVSAANNPAASLVVYDVLAGTCDTLGKPVAVLPQLQSASLHQAAGSATIWSVTITFTPTTTAMLQAYAAINTNQPVGFVQGTKLDSTALFNGPLAGNTMVFNYGDHDTALKVFQAFTG